MWAFFSVRFPFRINFGIWLSNILTTCLAQCNLLTHKCIVRSLSFYSLHSYCLYHIPQIPFICTGLGTQWRIPLPVESIVCAELSESSRVLVPHKMIEWMSVLWIALTNQAFTSQCLGNQLQAHTVTLFYARSIWFLLLPPTLICCISWKRDAQYRRLAEIHTGKKFETRYGALNELCLSNRAWRLMSKCASHEWMNSICVQALPGPMHLGPETDLLCPMICH